MKIKELRTKTAGELKRLLLEERVRLGTLRFKASSASLKAVRDIRTTKRGIAQILTIIREQSRGELEVLRGSRKPDEVPPTHGAKKGAAV